MGEKNISSNKASASGAGGTIAEGNSMALIALVSMVMINKRLLLILFASVRRLACQMVYCIIICRMLFIWATTSSCLRLLSLLGSVDT